MEKKKKTINLNTKINNNIFKSCIYNASGPRCTHINELKSIDISESSLVLSKSATLNLRNGNSPPRYFHNKLGSINSMGLPNNGIQYYLDLSGEIKKHLYISISGLSLEENLQILDKILKDVNIKFIDS